MLAPLAGRIYDHAPQQNAFPLDVTGYSHVTVFDVLVPVRRRDRQFGVGMLLGRKTRLVVYDLAGQPTASSEFLALFDADERKMFYVRSADTISQLAPPQSVERARLDSAVDDYCRVAKVNPDREWATQRSAAAGLTNRIVWYSELRETLGPTPPSYIQLLHTFEWLSRREEILARDDWTCTSCRRTAQGAGDVILQVHHKYYVRMALPWAYPDVALTTLCLDCHQRVHDQLGVLVLDSVDGHSVPTDLVPCYRCKGSGYFPQYMHIENGVCFRCRGAQFEMPLENPPLNAL